nr:translation initiation factor 1 [Suriana maritima]
MIISSISGRIRHSFICIPPREKVKIEGSHFDSTRGGSIIYRLRKSND